MIYTSRSSSGAIYTDDPAVHECIKNPKASR